MRLAFILLALAVGLGLGQPALAQEGKKTPYKGIWLSTSFPSFTVTGDESVMLDLTVHNAGMPPGRVALNVDKAPDGWKKTFLGAGKRVGAVFVAPGDDADVKLRLEPPAKVQKGTYHFVVTASGKDSHYALPIDLSVGEALPPKLTLKSDLPDLRGSATSDFTYKLTVKNEGGSDATVRLDSEGPPGFQVKFTEEYGSQELTSFPLKAGEDKTISAKVSPPQSTKQGSYPLLVRASTGKTAAATRLTMEVTGQPDLSVTGKGERLSSDAYAGEETPIAVVLTNNGSAPARNIKLSSTPPSGWKISFEPKAIDVLLPDKTETVKANITPSSRAIAGDYMVSVKADGDGSSSSSDFRITVRTSTLWGVIGVLVIASALVILVLAVVRYGRR